ncbi:MAG: helix-turn-helix domain-containing protein [Candidatus Thermoplasmatota archaeon]|nr:helix-turn-helix domain-containing protein [Candidatus Thermoplasmatota archaeon]
MEPFTFNETQAARVIGVSRSTFRRYVAKGELPAPRRLGKRLLYSRRALMEWLERAG